MAQFLKLYRNRELNIYENTLYSLLLNLCGLTGGSIQKSRIDLLNLFPSEISEPTLRRSISVLEEKGYIKVTRLGKSKNSYSILKYPNNLDLTDPRDNQTWISQIQQHGSNRSKQTDLTDPLNSENMDLTDPTKKNINIKELILKNFFKSEKKQKNQNDFFNPLVYEPTMEMIKFVVANKNIKNIDKVSEDFLNYYQSTNWVNSNNINIRDWVAILNYWCSQAIEKENKETQPKFIKQYKDKTLEDFTSSAKAQLMKFAESREKSLMEKINERK